MDENESLDALFADLSVDKKKRPPLYVPGRLWPRRQDHFFRA
jgi:hypothetical protein